jgi:hypothetical protein
VQILSVHERGYPNMSAWKRYIPRVQVSISRSAFVGLSFTQLLYSSLGLSA